MKTLVGITAVAMLALLTLTQCSAPPTGSGGGSGGSATGGGSGGGATGGGSGGSATGGGSGGGATGGGTGACAQSGTGCNTLTQLGAMVTQIYSSATPPTPQGGTMLTGTYVMTASTRYVSDGGSGPAGDVRAQTAAFDGTMVQILETRATDGGCLDLRNTGTVVFAGASLTFTQTCPSCSGTDCGGQQGYTASGNTFTIFENRGGGSDVRTQVFTKQ